MSRVLNRAPPAAVDHPSFVRRHFDKIISSRCSCRGIRFLSPFGAMRCRWWGRSRRCWRPCRRATRCWRGGRPQPAPPTAPLPPPEPWRLRPPLTGRSEQPLSPPLLSPWCKMTQAGAEQDADWMSIGSVEAFERDQAARSLVGRGPAEGSQ